jgi:hypothetical protein
MLKVEQLDEFEHVVREQLGVDMLGRNEPAGDAQIENLYSALEPYAVPADVETLYRWSDGAEGNAFAGRVFLSIVQMLRAWEDRRLGIDTAVLLPLFRDAGAGRLVVETDHPMRDPAVWLLQKDIGPTFQYSSLDAFITTLTAASRAGLLTVTELGNDRRVINVRDAVDYEALMGELNPSPPPLEARKAFFPEVGWPESWLAGLGIDKSAQQPRGLPSPRFGDLISQSRFGDVKATITGTVGARRNVRGATGFTISDGDSELWVEIPSSALAFEIIPPRVRLEVDVELGPQVNRENEDLRRFPGHPARGKAVRWYPSEWR